MFQSFVSNSNKAAGPERLGALRKQLRSEGLTAFLVPHADEHQNEYLPERAERLAWLTGFTGSAGFAIATTGSCAVFVDGRYTLQVREQVDTGVFGIESLVENPPSKWLENNTDKDDVIGYDPWLITIRQHENYLKSVEKTGATLKPVENLIDRIWKDQPDAPSGKVFVHPNEYAGKDAHEKLKQIQKAVLAKNCELTALTDPSSLAWLFNIRGTDVAHNPLPLGFVIIPVEGKPTLFMEQQKLDPVTKTYLEELSFVEPQEVLLKTLEELAKGKTILCDGDRTPAAIAQVIADSNGNIVKGRDPVILPRAIKNKTELAGARATHLRDGVAICKFLYWLDHQKIGIVSEISAAQKLEEIRRENAVLMGSELKEIAFDTISGHGPNGAIVHYRVTEETNRIFSDNSLYLCDSGGQYVDGTTDITRTIAVGTPPKAAVTDFTLVLKGHIAIATARFPEGTRGVDIDVLARNTLWQHGKDFAHGTGHGVGSYLNVHEGPQSISKRGMEPLVPGMIVSNEPGYYAEGQYGIRIENLVIVREAEAIKNGNVKTHFFETITLAPIDTRLIDSSLLTEFERNWINAYHQRVWKTLSVHLQVVERNWLERATSEIQ
ncbi:MAG: aminopeptidase P family protein [Rhizobiaceae bacterium]